MIGPEHSKKSGKSGKKKAKAKKAKRPPIAAVPTVLGIEPQDDPRPLTASAEPSSVPPAFGPPLLAWIDRVQARVDHLLTLVDVPAEAASGEPTSAEAGPTSGPTVDEPAEVPATADEPAEAPAFANDPVESVASEDGSGRHGEELSLAEAWARRLEATEIGQPEPVEPAEVGQADDLSHTDDLGQADDLGEAEFDETEPLADFGDVFEGEPPFEPVTARLSAVLVARELVARGVAPADVRRRLRDGYGVDDPDAVLSRIAA